MYCIEPGNILVKMGLVARKPVFGVSHKASFKTVSIAAETQAGLRLCCSQTPKDRFSHDEAKISYWNIRATCLILRTIVILGPGGPTLAR